MNQTERALLSRGFDAGLAKRLVNGGHTLSSLKTLDRDSLLSLGITEQYATGLLSEKRPPIPIENLTKLLFDNRFTCCVCREAKKPIIVHHIDAWEHSRNHEPSNLAVLCLEDHNRAHTRSELSRNLDKPTLQRMKAEWESLVRRKDSEAVIRATSVDFHSWAYFNHLRLFEMASEYKIKFRSVRGYQNLRSMGLVDSNGLLVPRDKNSMYMYQGPEILHLHEYTKSVMKELLRRVVILNISDNLDKGDLPHVVLCGDLIYVAGPHSFGRITRNTKGPGQITRGVRSANGVCVKFIFDAWEALSSSAWADWLSGTRRAGTLLQVRSVQREEGKLVIEGTVIGISNGYGELKTRDYVANHGRFIQYDDDDAEDADVYRM